MNTIFWMIYWFVQALKATGRAGDSAMYNYDKAVKETVMRLLQDVVKDGGATYVLNDNGEWDHVKYTHGYQVGTGIEARYSSDVYSAMFDAVLYYIDNENSDMWDRMRSFGLWQDDDGDWVLDINPVHIMDYDVAMRVARAYEQEAIYDWCNDETIFVDNTLTLPVEVGRRLRHKFKNANATVTKVYTSASSVSGVVEKGYFLTFDDEHLGTWYYTQEDLEEKFINA